MLIDIRFCSVRLPVVREQGLDESVVRTESAVSLVTLSAGTKKNHPAENNASVLPVESGALGTGERWVDFSTFILNWMGYFIKSR